MFSRIITNRKGTFIVDAAIALPVFLISIMVMSSVILMYVCIEDSSFIAANEIRRGAAEAVYADTSLLIPYRIRSSISSKHSRVERVRLTDFGYRTSRWGQDELILLTFDIRLSSPNPIGIRAAADHRLPVVTRAYVGKIRSVQPMSESEMAGGDSEPVFIFPKRGEKYHSKGCGFLTAASRTGVLTEAVRKDYKPCPLCSSSSAADGALIYYFPAAGESYHLPGCSALQRNYIETDKNTAIERGYTPCAKCGG